MRLLHSTKEFLHKESASGVVMIFAALIAIILANSPAADAYQNLISAGVPFTKLLLKDFVKDVLMVIFFFHIGLELKREAKEGFLKDRSQMIMPLVAAIFGMVVPAVIFLLFNYKTPEHIHGWAIPSATDIAFAVCVLLLVTKNFPAAAKIFLLAIAIFDDLGAILIIAFFYSSGVKFVFLLYSAILIGVLITLNHLKVKNIKPYIVCGAMLAYLLHEAGIHTTIAGVITAIALPFTVGSYSPVKDMINKLHFPVGFVILPLFALVSAGVAFGGLSAQQMFSPISLGIIFGLFVGKQLGIFLPTYLLDKLGFIKKPENVSWGDIYIVSIVAGIGFTMSLFVGMLAYTSPILQEEVKFGVLVGSLLSAALAAIIARVK